MPANFSGAFDLTPAKATSTASGGSYVTVGTDSNFTEVIQLSNQVAVVVELWSERAGSALTPVLDSVVREFQGRLVLVRVDVDANPQLAQAFQAEALPAVIAVLGGRPAPVFAGVLNEAQVREALTSVLDAAARMGITGAVDSLPSPADNVDAAAEDPAEHELTPVQQAAFDALEAGDIAAAVEVYEKALVVNPRDEDSIAGLANVRLMLRLQDDPATLVGVEAALAQADHLFADQLIEPALTGLLDAWGEATAEQRETIRGRLLEFFTLLGADSPFVGPARARLASLLY